MQWYLLLINMEREGTDQDIWALVNTDSGKAMGIPLRWQKDEDELTVD